MSPPRLGFLGTGWIGLKRLQSLQDLHTAEIVGVADENEAQLSQALKMAPLARGFRHLEDLLKEDLDAIVISTPNAGHSQQAVRCLDHGISVYCQKPLGRDLREVQEVVSASKRNDRRLGLDFCYRSLHAVEAIKKELRENKIGKVFAIDAQFHNAYGPDKPWFFDPALAGGGCLMDLGIHLFDLLLWLLDFPRVRTCDSQLFRHGKRLMSDEVCEDFAVVNLELENEILARIACSWNLPAGRDAQIEFRIFGTHGGLALTNVGGSFYDFKAERYDGTRTQTLEDAPDNWGGRTLATWVKNLENDHSYDEHCEEYLCSAELLDRAYKKRTAWNRQGAIDQAAF
jgi:predicted dehydrogenase